jgi:alkylation response protein AidB-like acyl-CoA dehydrogenase
MLQRAAAAKCAGMVGGAQWALETTVDYVKQRVQFGRTIGSLQAIQTYCVQMLTDLDTSRFLTYEAAWKMSEGLPHAREVAIAKAWMSDASKQISALAHQCLGGVGFMQDHDLTLYTVRAKADELAFGDADFHREILAQELKL